MKNSGSKALWAEIVEEYRKKNPKSEAFFHSVSKSQVGGGSHNLRLFSPFPFYDSHCSGSKVRDIDGNTYIDFWQGHFSNILGHNPQIIRDALIDYFQKGQGLITGFPHQFQLELAELILSRCSADKIRFTTSGTLATMYAVMLAKSFTNRSVVLKIGGGWHGAQPYTLKGISSYKNGFNKVESAGLPYELKDNIITTRFNDCQDLKDKFEKNGDRIACLIIEPFIGAGGFIFGEKEYLEKAGQLTKKYGALLIFDEVVSGFRFHAGFLQRLYGIKPDMTVLGKSIGGGMPLSAVAGRGEILSLCDTNTNSNRRVKFEGGTFSAHPSALLSGLTFLKYLIKDEGKIYPKINKMGEMVRKKIEEIFIRNGFNVKCTGVNESMGINSSIVGVHFLREKVDHLVSPDEVWNEKVCNFEMREKIFRLAMINKGFNTFHGYGAISYAHTKEEIQASLDAVECIASNWKKIPDKIDKTIRLW